MERFDSGVAKKNGLQAGRERRPLQPSSPRSVLMYRMRHCSPTNKITEGCRPSGHCVEPTRFAPTVGTVCANLQLSCDSGLTRGTLFDGPEGEFDAVVGSGLAEHAAEVGLDGGFVDAEGFGDGAVGAAVHEVFE